MDGRPTWTDCDQAGDYVVPNVLSPRDLVSRPDKTDTTVPHMSYSICFFVCLQSMTVDDVTATWVFKRVSSVDS